MNTEPTPIPASPVPITPPVIPPCVGHVAAYLNEFGGWHFEAVASDLYNAEQSVRGKHIVRIFSLSDLPREEEKRDSAKPADQPKSTTAEEREYENEKQKTNSAGWANAYIGAERLAASRLLAAKDAEIEDLKSQLSVKTMADHDCAELEKQRDSAHADGFEECREKLRGYIVAKHLVAGVYEVFCKPWKGVGK